MKNPGDSIFVWTRRLWRWTDPDRPQSAVAIVVANLIPLVGAVFLGWNVGAIIVLYWFECVIVGLLNLPKIALAHGGSATTGAWAIGRILEKVVAVPFFVVHYGVFLLATGGGVLFVAVAAGGSLPPTNGTPEADLRQTFAMLDLPVAGLTVAAIGLLISHLVSFNDFLVNREFERVNPITQMGAPYPRVFMLLAAALASGTVIAVMGSPVWAVASFVIGKTVLDLRLSGSEGQRHAE